MLTIGYLFLVDTGAVLTPDISDQTRASGNRAHQAGNLLSAWRLAENERGQDAPIVLLQLHQ